MGNQRPTTAPDERCPVPGGEFGADYGAYGLRCNACPLAEACAKEHDRQRAHWQERRNRAHPLFVTIPAGLYDDPDLKRIEREIIALVAFRVRGRDGHAYDKNTTMAQLFGVSKGHVSKTVDSLCDRDYLRATHQTLKKRGRNLRDAPYRTSRKLGLGIRAVRLLNRTRRDEDPVFKVFDAAGNGQKS